MDSFGMLDNKIPLEKRSYLKKIITPYYIQVISNDLEGAGIYDDFLQEFGFNDVQP